MSARMIFSPSSASAMMTPRQALGKNEKRLDLCRCARVDERGAAGQLSDFGKELAWSLFDDRDHMAQSVPGADGNRARDEHEHAGASFAGYEQEIARFITKDLAEPVETRYLLRPEFWGTSDRGAVLSWT
jgi:hypothetical protein